MVREERLYDIICIADAPWKYPLWTNKQRIMSRLAKQGHRIVYVDPPIGFAGWYKWWRQGRRSFRDLYDWVQRPGQNITLYSPILFPPRYAWGRRLDEWWRRGGIRRLSKKLGLSNTIVWAYHPDAVELLAGLPRHFLLYDCVDQYRAFPAYREKSRQEEIVDRENRLLAEADAVITTSRPLFEDKKTANPNTFLVENVGDYDNFHRAADGSVELSELIKPIKRPRIGFVGALDSYKVDFDILKGIADSRPEWSIVLVGPIAEGGEADEAKELLSKKNVRSLGAHFETELPSILRGFDAAIIPYKLNDYTSYCFPLKVFEFLAAGLPIVVTPLPALAEMGDLLRQANTVDGLVNAIEDYLLQDPEEKRLERMEAASKHTYETRSKAILEIIRTLWKE